MATCSSTTATARPGRCVVPGTVPLAIDRPTDHVFQGWTASEIDHFIERPLDSAPLASGCDVESLIATIELVLSERGVGFDRRLGAVARQIALAWLVDEAELPDAVLMGAFEIDRIGTLRTAVSRARALLRSEPAFVDVQSRAISLVAAAPTTSRV